MLRTAGSLPTLQRLFGHDCLTSTEMYFACSPKEMIRAFRET